VGACFEWLPTDNARTGRGHRRRPHRLHRPNASAQHRADVANCGGRPLVSHLLGVLTRLQQTGNASLVLSLVGGLLHSCELARHSRGAWRSGDLRKAGLHGEQPGKAASAGVRGVQGGVVLREGVPVAALEGRPQSGVRGSAAGEARRPRGERISASPTSQRAHSLRSGSKGVHPWREPPPGRRCDRVEIRISGQSGGKLRKSPVIIQQINSRFGLGPRS